MATISTRRPSANKARIMKLALISMVVSPMSGTPMQATNQPPATRRCPQALTGLYRGG